MTGGGQYAAGTTVPVGRTRDEIERVLARYGATGFAFGQDQAGAMVAFTIRDRHVRFVIPLPTPDMRGFTHSGGGRPRTKQQADAAWQQAIKARWRALGLIVKAKLEAVDAGVVTFDEEFMAHLVIPSGQTVGDVVLPQMQTALEGGQLPALLPGRPA